MIVDLSDNSLLDLGVNLNTPLRNLVFQHTIFFHIRTSCVLLSLAAHASIGRHGRWWDLFRLDNAHFGT